MTETHQSMQPAKPEAGTTNTLLRICVLGPLDIAWERQDTLFPRERLMGRGAAPALGLLKALLSQPDRFATRDWLLEQFWPESTISRAQERLDDVASGLRTLLRPAGSAVRILQYVYGSNGKGSGYRLEGYPLIWVDADAFTWSVEQAARFERFGQDALPLWEQAYHLGSRGPFLPEDIYSDWAKTRREDLAGQYRQCVHRLTTLLRERGTSEQALLRLRTYWQTHPTDEDMLRPLMEILGHQEQYQEAEEAYRQLLLVLAEQGPDDDGQLRVPDVHTTDLREYLRTQHVQRTPSASLNYRTGCFIVPFPHIDLTHISSSSQNNQETPPLPMMDGVSQRDENARDCSIWFGTKLAHLVTVIDHWQGQAFSCDHLQALLNQEILEIDTMKRQFHDEPYTLSRRQSLVAIATLPVALCTSVQQGTTTASLTEQLLTRCAASITSLWHLLKGSELSLIEQTLSTYLLTLVTLAQQPSPYQTTAARLTSQAYRLYGIIALHRNNLKARKKYCQQALYFSTMAEDTRLVVSAHISLASTFYYEKNPKKAAEIYQQALQQEAILPLQRARLHAELAVASAQQKQEQDALNLLDYAQDVYPDHPETDPSFFYAEFTPASMILEQGLTYLALSQQFPDRGYEQQAWNSFIQIETLQTENTVPERIFFEIANHQAETAIELRNMEQFQIFLQKGIEGANRLHSIQRHQEIREIYTHGLRLWPHERRVKQIEDLFH